MAAVPQVDVAVKVNIQCDMPQLARALFETCREIKAHLARALEGRDDPARRLAVLDKLWNDDIDGLRTNAEQAAKELAQAIFSIATRDEGQLPGMVVDGHHRRAAARRLGIVPPGTLETTPEPTRSIFEAKSFPSYAELIGVLRKAFAEHTSGSPVPVDAVVVREFVQVSTDGAEVRVRGQAVVPMTNPAPSVMRLDESSGVVGTALAESKPNGDGTHSVPVLIGMLPESLRSLPLATLIRRPNRASINSDLLLEDSHGQFHAVIAQMLGPMWVALAEGCRMYLVVAP